jgi:uncharacterized protein YndB with AHSA1/START domain
MKRRVTLERTFPAPIAHVWELWTTKDGIESWWGPHGFRVEVHSIDVRAGGKLHYSMIAVAPEMIEFMKKANMSPATRHELTYREVVPYKRLAYLQLTDFVPGVAPYDIDTLVVLDEQPDGGVKMTLTFDAMHDDMWTERAALGWKQQFEKLERVLAP